MNLAYLYGVNNVIALINQIFWRRIFLLWSAVSSSDKDPFNFDVGLITSGLLKALCSKKLITSDLLEHKR